MKKSLLLFAVLFLAFSVELSYSQDTLWTRRYEMPGFIKNAIFSPDDSKILVTGTETFFEVNPQNGEMIREMPEFTKSGIWDVDAESNLGITYDGKLVNLSDYSLFNDFVKYLKSKYSPTQGYSYNKDFTRTVVKFNGKDSETFDTLRIINARTNEEISEIYLEQSVQSLGNVQISPDGRYLALFHFYYGIKEIDGKIYEGDDHMILRLFDVMSKQEIKKMTFPPSAADWTLKFSPDGSMLAMRRGAGVDAHTVPDLDFINNFRFVPSGGGINDYTFTKNSDNLMIVRVGQIQTFYIHENKLIAENLSPDILGQFIRFANTTDNVLISNHANHDEAIYLLSSKITSIKNEDQLTIIHLNSFDNLLILKLANLQFTNFKIIILNNEGRTVFTQDYISTNEDVSIDVSGYLRGVYFVNIESDNKVLQTYKFIKE